MPTADEALRRVCQTLLQHGPAAAAQRTADFLRTRPEWAGAGLAAMHGILSQALSAQQGVLDTFDRDKGKVLTVPLTRGTMQGTVVAAENGRVHLTLTGGAERSFTVDDLDVQERLKRLGRAGDSPGGTLLKGLWACRSHARDRAKTLFATLTAPLGPALVAAMDEPLEAP